MSSISSAATPVRAPDFDVHQLRHPSEQSALLACICANIAVIALAVFVVFAGTEWLHAHPLVHHEVDAFRVVAIAAILMFPAALVGRHVSIDEAHANGILISEKQFPELHAELLRACEKLGLEQIPELYVGHVPEGLVKVHSTLYPRRHSILIESDWIFDKHWKYGMDWISFTVAGAVGAIRLGHTKWWVEMLTAYAKRIPGLRTPLMMAWTFSRDRCAAHVVPEGVRGLIIVATGKDMIWEVDIAEIMKQHVPTGIWAWLAAVHRKAPHVLTRMRALYQDGFFDYERDLARAARREEEWGESWRRAVDHALPLSPSGS
jgi:hypothetical protein